MHNNERDTGKLFHPKKLVTYQTWVLLQLFKFDLTQHFKALHPYLSHNHNKLGIILQKIKQSF